MAHPILQLYLCPSTTSFRLRTTITQNYSVFFPLRFPLTLHSHNKITSHDKSNLSFVLSLVTTFENGEGGGASTATKAYSQF